MKVYLNGRIFDGKKIISNQCVLTENGRVVGFVDSPPTRAELVDLKNGLLAPAFLDLQIYGGNGQLFSDSPSVESLSAMVKYSSVGGAAWILPTVATNSEEIMFAAMAAVHNYWLLGGRGVLGLHLEGPFIEPQKRGAHLEKFIRKPTLKTVQNWWQNGAAGVVKMMTLAPEICPDEVLHFLVKTQKIVVSAGHSNAAYAESQAAFEKGIKTATHLFNAMPPFYHRKPGLVGAIFDHPGVRASIVADGYHVDFSVIRAAKKLLKNRLFLITDAVTESASGPYPHRRSGDRYVVADGTLSGSALTMWQAVKNCVERVGIPLEESLRMASLYPAQVMGLQKRFGKIAPGFDDDFVLLNERLDLMELPGRFF